jgi:hypothetical protein
MANETLALVLKQPIDELTPAMIEFNADEIIAKIKDKVEFYKQAKYSEATIKQAKEDKASLNKFVKGINAERIAIGKVYEAPYLKFKSGVDRIIALVGDAITNIDGQLNDFEKARITARRELCKGHWYLIAGDELTQHIPYERIEDSKWLNASTSDKKAKEAVENVYEGVINDLQTIQALRSEDVDTLTLYYYKTLSLQETLRENERRKAESLKIAELRAKREADEQERRAREEAEKRAFLAAKQARELEEQRNAPEVGEVPAEFIPPETAEVTQATAEPTPPPAPKLVTVRFEAIGTVEQLKALQAFIRNNGIKIKSI